MGMKNDSLYICFFTVSLAFSGFLFLKGRQRSIIIFSVESEK